MLEKELTVKLKDGLRARPAALFVQKASRFKANVYLGIDERIINAKSIMGIMSLAIEYGTTVRILTDGIDEDVALTTLEKYL
ncbi:HPr family phosphocarrier protein [Pseudalkalibacillus sp. A8]|uniref:HPr family phosphocarrier protein n=1 Tax=Pseudalkalibacillus sp. A8 TaxID=3382641 RepID=UPI0038B50D39